MKESLFLFRVLSRISRATFFKAIDWKACPTSGTKSSDPCLTGRRLAPGIRTGGVEMFDKLIESNSAAAEFKPRRKYFMVSSVVVGVLFLSAVVFSLYAQDLDLGTDEFELSTLIAPPDQNIPEPEPPRQEQRQQNSNTPQTEYTSRRDLIASLDQPQE